MSMGRLIVVGAVTLALGAVGVGCGGGEDDKPPQILPHLNPVAFQNFNPGSAAEQFEVIFQNDGGGTLVITDVEVRGDVNCALNPAPELDSALPVSLTHSDQAFLQMTYIPGGIHNDAVGTKDQISIALTSNSAEFPLFEISVCGCIVDGDTQQAPPCECNLLDVPAGNCGG